MNKKKLIKDYVKCILLEASQLSATEELSFRHVYNFLKKNVDDEYKNFREKFDPFEEDKLIKVHGKKYITNRLIPKLDKLLEYKETSKYIKKLSPVKGSVVRKKVYLYHDPDNKKITMIDNGNLTKLLKNNTLENYEKVLKALIPNTDSINKGLLEELIEKAKNSLDPIRKNN